MSIEVIISAIKKLTALHHDVLELSEQKTEAVKEGALEDLQTLLIKERKYTQVLERAESKRKQAVDEWFIQHGFPVEEATLTNMLEQLEDEQERQTLEEHTVALTEAIVKLKQQEELNMALIQQSMQFVQLSLDLLNPSLKTMNYGKENNNSNMNRSVFDSKA